MTTPKFTIFNGLNGQFYFNLKSSNGEIILNSEGYISNQGCRNGIMSVKENSPYDSRYIKNTSYSGFTFNLKSTNGEIIGRSETYTTSMARDNGIAAVKRDAPVATISDQS